MTNKLTQSIKINRERWNSAVKLRQVWIQLRKTWLLIACWIQTRLSFNGSPFHHCWFPKIETAIRENWMTYTIVIVIWASQLWYIFICVIVFLKWFEKYSVYSTYQFCNKVVDMYVVFLSHREYQTLYK